MSSNSQKFIIIGPHAGKTILVNGHQFVDGEMTFHGSESQITVLARVLSFYGAQRAEQVSLEALIAEKQANIQAETEKTSDENVADLEQPSEGNDPVDEPADATPTLAEAIGTLDPENDAHWTSNNLPGLDDLEKLTGKKVARADVEAIAPGYTRAKARQAKAMM